MISNSEVIFPNTNNIFDLNSWTIEIWIKPTDICPDSYICNPIIWKLANNNTLTSMFYITLNGTGFPRIGLQSKDNEADLYLVSSESVKLNIWSHLAFTFDFITGNMSLYLNGQVTAHRKINSKTKPCMDVGSLYLGTSNFLGHVHSGYFNGLISEIRIWNYSRTLDEINTNKLKMLSSMNNKNGLVVAYSLREGVGALVAPLYGSAPTGSMTNCIWSLDIPSFQKTVRNYEIFVNSNWAVAEAPIVQVYDENKQRSCLTGTIEYVSVNNQDTYFQIGYLPSNIFPVYRTVHPVICHGSDLIKKICHVTIEANGMIYVGISSSISWLSFDGICFGGFNSPLEILFDGDSTMTLTGETTILLS
eukprot:c21546_g1_i2.p1 GENE.c21546_g1_i2~~c21546_g1_i2.p1  ORF type:complete len:362 (+),score=81.47 c21546_g1_i2:182-1267(+)